MSLISSLSTLLLEHQSTFLSIISFVLAYMIYRYTFRGIIFRTVGNYEQKLKNIGRPLPPFPNGWYIVARSSELKKG